MRTLSRHYARIAVLVLVTAFSLLAAEETKLTVDFDAGHRGVIPQSQALVPVRVTVRNKLRNLKGTIEIRQPNARGSEVVLKRPFKSPAPSTMMFEMLPRIEAAGGVNGNHLEVKVIFDDRQVKTFQKAFHNKSGRRLILCLGIPELYIKGADFTEPKNQREHVWVTTAYQFVATTRPEIPTSPEVYDSVHGLMISTLELSRLSPKQQDALADWIAYGGRLIVFDNGGSRAALAFLGAEGRDQLYRSTVEVAPWGAGFVARHVVLDSKERPFWCFQANLQKARLILPDMTITMGPMPPSSPDIQVSGQIERLTSREEEGTYGVKGLFWLTLIILAYCLVVGPLDWWVVKRSGKSWLTWPVFALSVVGFSYVAYWYSGLVQSAPMTSVQLNIVDQVHGRQTMRGNTIYWLYSTGNFVFNLSTNKANNHLACRESAGMDKSAVAWTNIMNGKKSFIETRIPVFSDKQFDATWHEPARGIIEETREEKQAIFQLPEHLNVQLAYLAQGRGIEQLTIDSKNHTLTSANKNITWNSFSSSLGEYDRDVLSKMPTDKGLQQYLLLNSVVDMAVGGLDEVTIESRNQRSQREKRLSIASTLEGGTRVLLLFLDRENSLHQLDSDREIPNALEMNLLRYYLPK